MELADTIRRRRMVRAFSPRPVAPDVLERVLRAALSGPSAGNTQALELVVLEGADQTATFWNASLPPEERSSFLWPHLLDAPVLIVLLTRPGAYVERYGEPDKASTGLGGAEAAWPVPYWYVDGGMGALLLLLGAVDEGLGALFFGIFRRKRAVLDALGVPGAVRPIGVVALGHPADALDRPSRSAARGRRPFDDVVHRGRW